ncbi:MAG: hypothetical protein D6714_10445 [Bacteroidetes bacterium]|nr:MAG: hypothetical protein D6714_10445 [Bacteroidota bacterium]
MQASLVRSITGVGLMMILPIYVLTAQNKLHAWLEYHPADGANVVRGWFQNNQVLPAVFEYVFTVVQMDTTLTARNRFRAASGEKTALSRATYTFDRRTKEKLDKIKLEVFKYGQLVASDSLVFRRQPPSVPPAKPAPKTLAIATEDLEIDGLILDETRSKPGHDFYEIFYNQWTPPAEAKGYIITIRELPARGRGTQISVEINDQTLIRRFLSPRNDQIESLAHQVVAMAREHLEKLGELQNQILSEDLQGSGIY